MSCAGIGRCTRDKTISHLHAPGGRNSWPLTYRWAWHDDQLNGKHRYADFGISNLLDTQMGAAFNTFNSYSIRYGPGPIKWIGSNGIQTDKSGSCHCNGTAMDVSAVVIGGQKLDCNVAWRQPGLWRRRYLALAVALRRYCVYVQIYTDNDTRHRNHIHADMYGSGRQRPLSSSSSKDARLIQTLCNEFNGASLKVDGKWGSATWAAYNRLLAASGHGCREPHRNMWHMMSFLLHIMKCGLGGHAANRYAGPCPTKRPL